MGGPMGQGQAMLTQAGFLLEGQICFGNSQIAAGQICSCASALQLCQCPAACGNEHGPQVRMHLGGMTAPFKLVPGTNHKFEDVMLRS